MPRKPARPVHRVAAAKIPIDQCPRSRTKLLRPHQSEVIGQVVRTTDNLLVEAYTGVGKTLMIIAAGSYLLRNGGYEGAVVITPFNHIKSAFTDRDYDAILPPKGQGLVGFPQIVNSSFVVDAADQGTSGAAVASYLEVPQKHMLACSHQAILKAKLPKKLERRVLFVDESQFAPARELSKVIDRWVKHGGRVVYFTATGFRGDGKFVLIPGMFVYRLPLAWAMQNGWAPKNLDVSIVPLILKDVTAKRFRGEVAPSAITIPMIAEVMVQTWIADGRPPSIVHVPPQTGGTDAFIRRVISEFEKAGARVHDASGVGERQQRELNDLLTKDRDGNYTTRSVDVIVGIQRTVLGTDWPVCAAVYVFGLPGSTTKVVQLIGRPSRLKGDGHPFKDNFIARFFVETLNDETRDILQKTQSADALAICCLLADLESPATWEFEAAFTQALRDGAQDADHAADMKVEFDTTRAATDFRARVQHQLNLAAAHEQGPIKVSDAARIMAGSKTESEERHARRRMDASSTVADGLDFKLSDAGKRILAEHILSMGGRVKERADEVIRRISRKSMADGFPVNVIERDVLNGLIAEFRDETLKPGPNMKRFADFAHVLTGSNMRKYADKILGRTPLTVQMVQTWGDNYLGEFEVHPKPQDGGLHLPKGEDWAKIHYAFTKGKRGLPRMPGGLPEFFGYNKPVLTETIILKWADRCHELTGEYPSERTGKSWQNLDDTRTSEEVGLPSNESWNGVNLALSRSLRGLPGGSSLYQLLRKHNRIPRARRP